MKRIFIFTILAVLLASCQPCQPDNSVVKKVETVRKNNVEVKTYDVYNMSVRTTNLYLNEEFAVVIIDSCEYIISTGTGYRGYMAHKGNCKHCAKKRVEEMRKVLREEGVSNKLW